MGRLPNSRELPPIAAFLCRQAALASTPWRLPRNTACAKTRQKLFGGNDGRRGKSSSFAFFGRIRARFVPDQADRLVRSSGDDRRLRYRRHRLCRAALDRRMAHPAEGARPGFERQQYRRLVRLADLRLDRRPLRPQDRAHSCQPSVRRADLCGGLFNRSDPAVLAAFPCRARHRRRHSKPRRHQCRVRRRAIYARPWRSSPSA